MPTLIRLFVLLIVLAGLVFAGMIALTIFVDPGQREIRVRIPARDLMPGGEDAADPLNLRQQLPAPTVTTEEEPAAVTPAQPSDTTTTTTTAPADMSGFE
jgi:hypothetical protein